MQPDEALRRLRALGLGEDAARILFEHFSDSEQRGRGGHGFSRVGWLETLTIDPDAVPRRVEGDDAWERWNAAGALGYLALDAIVQATLAAPPRRARLIVAEQCFPTGALGYWTRRLAEGGLLAVLTATSPPRLPAPGGAGPPLTGTNPLTIAIPSSEGAPVVADVSMGAVTYGEVLAGRAAPEELVPFGGPLAHKAFALAVGLELFAKALVGEEHGAVLLVARPEHDPVPAFRELAAGVRLPGDTRPVG